MNGSWLAPVLGQLLTEATGKVIGDAVENVGKPGLGIDVFSFTVTMKLYRTSTLGQLAVKRASGAAS